jgi:hypothetical protein
MGTMTRTVDKRARNHKKQHMHSHMCVHAGQFCFCSTSLEKKIVIEKHHQTQAKNLRRKKKRKRRSSGSRRRGARERNHTQSFLRTLSLS